MVFRAVAAIVWVMCAACATVPRRGDATKAPVASNPHDRCVHGVACETCVKCHPELAARFEAAGDWCPEHHVPESQCGLCHPEVVIAPSTAPAGTDVQSLVSAGEDLPSLDSHAIVGKVTIFDFYADWCGPCRKVDEHVYEVLRGRADVAYRKLNVVSWESPLALHHLVAARVPDLPYVVIYGKDGKRLRSISGLDLDKLDQALREGGAR